MLTKHQDADEDGGNRQRVAAVQHVAGGQLAPERLGVDRDGDADQQDAGRRRDARGSIEALRR